MVRELGPLVFQAAAKHVRVNTANAALYRVLDNSFRRLAPEESRTSLGGDEWANEWPKNSAWDFVALGRGHDTAYWTEFLRALYEVDSDMLGNIEHEDVFLGRTARQPSRSPESRGIAGTFRRSHMVPATSTAGGGWAAPGTAHEQRGRRRVRIGIVGYGAGGRCFHAPFIEAAGGADTLETGAARGLLRDLGSHLVDQMLWLLGPATHVYGALDWTDRFGETTDCGFFLALKDASGAVSTVSAPKLNHSTTRELRAYGSEGRYIASGADVQAEALSAGRRPAQESATWGIDIPENWGTLAVAGGRSRVPSRQGNYAGFYTEFARAIRAGGGGPVPAAEELRTLEVLDAARRSALECRVVELGGPGTAQE